MFSQQHAGRADVDSAGTRTKIGFEVQLHGAVSTPLTSYKGLLWHDTSVIDGHRVFDNDAPKAGAITGITSGRQVAFDNNGGAMGFSADGTFDFKSVQMTASWSQELTVTITGYLDGAKQHATVVHVTDTGPTLVTLDWKGIDEVVMRPSHAIADPDQPHSGKQFVIDDVVVAHLVSAAPASVAPAHAFAGLHFAEGHDALAGVSHALATITALV